MRLNRNLSSIVKSAIGFNFLLISLLPLMAYAETQSYRYKLEKSQDEALCTHMTEVFNKDFRTPWKRGYLGQKPNPATQGMPMDQVFDRLPGVEYNERFAFNMLYSKYPSAPEFEAIHWREGRVIPAPPNDDPSWKSAPTLVAHFDIDNDGKLDWIVKEGFMDDIVSWRSQNNLKESLIIYNEKEFEPLEPLTTSDLWNGQKIHERHHKPRYLQENLLRPFLFEGKAYVATYQFRWAEKLVNGFSLPADEHMNILRVTSRSFHVRSEAADRSATQIVCTIRMIPQPTYPEEIIRKKRTQGKLHETE